MDKRKYEKIKLESRCLFLSGADNWHTRELKELGLKSILMTDGPNGVRRCNSDSMVIEESTDPATVFPTNTLLASTWNKELAYKYGEALGTEAKDKGVSILLGPGVNIKRNPLCGRNFEYLSEDPYLAGYISANYINGLQSNNIACSLKHFAANNQENYRNLINEIIDERALREIYLKPFEIAVKNSHPKTIMTSYNKINGYFSSDNKWLLDDVCRKEWGFDGVYMSDWRGLGHVVEATKAGLNLEMPTSGSKNAEDLASAVKAGLIDEKEVNERGLELARLVEKLLKTKDDNFKADYKSNHELAREIASDGIILLKNSDNILPLKQNDRVLYVGDLLYKDKFEGGGSSHATPKDLKNLCETLRDEKAIFAKGYELDKEKLESSLIDEVLEKIKVADKVIMFIGPDEKVESEGYDRKNLLLPRSQIELINLITKITKNVVVVLINGAPYELPFVGKINGLLEAYLGGEAYAEAIKDVLYGKSIPSGRLAETFPIRYEDVPSSKYFPGGSQTSEYRDSIFVGYRYYETHNIPVRYPFGFGLSYSNFSYSGLTTKVDKNVLKVSFKVKNLGPYDAKEVSEIYAGCEVNSVFKAKKELKEFVKTALKVNEEKTISIDIPLDNLKYFNVKEKKWVLDGGVYSLYVGGDSHKEAIKCNFKVSSKVLSENPYNSNELPSYYNGDVKNISSKEFSKLMGFKLPSKNAKWFPPFNEDNCLNTISHTIAGYILKKEVKNNPTLKANPEYLSQLLQMPFRQLIMMGGDKITREEIKGFYDFINGHMNKHNILLVKSMFSKI